MTEIHEAVAAAIRDLNQHKEEYVRAWLAKTGLNPDQCMLVQQSMPDGSIRLWVEPK